jgi:hypothetical protein
VKDGVEWVGVIKQNIFFYQCQIENTCEAIQVHDLPQNLPMGSFEKKTINAALMWNPMAHSFSSTLGSSILDELES